MMTSAAHRSSYLATIATVVLAVAMRFVRPNMRVFNKEICVGAKRWLSWPTHAHLKSIAHGLLFSMVGISGLVTDLDQINTGEFRGYWFGHLTSSGQPFRFWILTFGGLACSIGVLVFAIPQVVRGLTRPDDVASPQASRFRLLKFPARMAEESAKERFDAKHKDVRP